MSNVFSLSIRPTTSNITQKAFNSVVLIKSFSEPSPTTIQYTFRSSTYVEGNWLGQDEASAYVVVTVTGTGTGSNKSIVSFTANGYHQAESGYSADASVSVKTFIKGVNGHLEFAYGIVVSSTSGITLSWNGIGFNTPSGGLLGETGDKNVNPSDLQ